MSCPASCDDGNACTRDGMSGSAANCNLACTNVAITMCLAGDGCCPMGCNTANDADCMAVCGNGVLEAGESCDDGNTMPGDGCDGSCVSEMRPTVFRVDNAFIRDPHIFLNFIGCQDITDGELFGNPGANGQLNAAIDSDGDDPDNFLDLSIVVLFRPLDQTSGGMGTVEVGLAQCTAGPPIRCAPDPLNPTTATTFMNGGAGPCLMPYPGSTSGYSPSITTPDSPCLRTGQVDLTLLLSGTPVTLQDTDAGATYSGNPATALENGLLRGFISEADAMTTSISLGPLGERTLYSLLRGGGGCGAGDDRDTNGGVRGWWFYLNFDADQVIWTGP